MCKSIYISIFIIGLSVLTLEINAQCNGKERWDIKVMKDKDAIYVSKVHSTKYKSIEAINGIYDDYVPRPDNAPRLEIEKVLVKVKCKITKFKLEDDKEDGDGDYHVVIQDVKPPYRVMVSEIPNPDCNNVKTSKWINYFKKVRTYFESLPSKKEKKNNKSTGWKVLVNDYTFWVIGVLFRDQKHGNQKEQLKSYIEIHPILKLEVMK